MVPRENLGQGFIITYHETDAEWSPSGGHFLFDRHHYLYDINSYGKRRRRGKEEVGVLHVSCGDIPCDTVSDRVELRL
jgi:hypothetical protein